MQRTSSRLLLVLDLVAGLVVAVVYLGFANMSSDDGLPAFAGPSWLGWTIAVAVGLPVAVRRRWPIWVLAVVTAALTAASLLDITREPYVAAGLAAYLVGLAEPVRRSASALAVALPVAVGGVIVGEAVITPAQDWRGAVGVAALVTLVIAASGAAGAVVRGRREEAERQQQRRAERALDEERLRIARELHDIVSHSLSLIAVKAGIARHVALDGREAQQALDALEVIEETSRSSLAAMRRTLGVLRTSGAPLGPAPGLAGLESLADEAGRAGVDVTLSVDGADGFSDDVELTVHRIVQEALTNVVRHAAPTRCRATVEADAFEIRIDVVDDGPAAGRMATTPGLPGGGNGLLGMRERATMYGGSLTAGPRPEGGFGVSVRLLHGERR
ncbi:sensor histidine kinase [Nocardioides albertanoniae]|nr:histidine kinase [Nocardioides albertanoniae]